MPLDPAARVWPFGYSRLTPVVVERAYRTSIINSGAGREQRRALRERPRKTTRFGIIVAHDCYRAFMRELHRYQAVTFALPDWTRKTQTTSTLANGANSLSVGALEDWAAVGDAYDNAMCESFFATLECELLDRRKFKTKAEARMAIFEFIEGWYNPARRHSALGYQSPINYERNAAEGLKSASV